MTFLSLTRVLVALSFVCTVLSVPTFDSFVNQAGTGNVTVAINVPANSTDLYFRFTSSSVWQYTAVGFGQSMSGSLMFIMYPTQDGKNVTISPRLASGHSTPQSTKDVSVNLLSGSGIFDSNILVANFRCTGCRKWSTGSIDVTSENQRMIYAVGQKNSELKTDSVDASIQKHLSHDEFGLNLKKATGEAGVPVLTQQATTTNPSTPAATGAQQDDYSGNTKEFPIAVHAFLLIACFLVILPGGYLFLRVFNRVWLHAGVQTLGVIFLVAGVASGIVYNVQTKRQISYHQVLGIVTSLLVLAAFTLGLISHQYFKKRKVSSPLLKFHRIIGPSAILFGNGTIVSGFVFRDESNRILPFMVVFLGVVILVGAITFLMKKRQVRKAALVTPAAQNFNAGYYAQNAGPASGQHHHGFAAQGYPPPPSSRGDDVPMQTFGRQQYHAHYAQHDPYKAPNVSVRPANQI